MKVVAGTRSSEAVLEFTNLHFSARSQLRDLNVGETGIGRQTLNRGKIMSKPRSALNSQVKSSCCVFCVQLNHVSHFKDCASWGTENPHRGPHDLANTSLWRQNIRFLNSGFSNRDIRGAAAFLGSVTRSTKFGWRRQSTTINLPLPMVVFWQKICLCICVSFCICICSPNRWRERMVGCVAQLAHPPSLNNSKLSQFSGDLLPHNTQARVHKTESNYINQWRHNWQGKEKKENE